MGDVRIPHCYVDASALLSFRYHLSKFKVLPARLVQSCLGMIGEASCHLISMRMHNPVWNKQLASDVIAKILTSAPL